MKVKVIFVCTGNICRSPMAEMIFKEVARKAGLQETLEVSSAGLASYHIGELPHIGTQMILAANQIPLDEHKRAQQVNLRSLESYDYIIALDHTHLSALRGLGNVHLMLEYASPKKSMDVPDPYYTHDFRETYDLLTEACQGLLNEIQKKYALE